MPGLRQVTAAAVIPISGKAPVTPIDFALRYAALGWHVFPVWQVASDGKCACGNAECDNVGKHPLSALAPWGQKNATTDEATIRRWWAQRPQANVAIHLAPSGLCAIDIDPRNGGLLTMEMIEAKHGPVVSDVLAFTGGGGEHRVFVLPTGYALPGKLGKGVDVKANGYIVAAPSNHASGNYYQWEGSSDPTDGALPSNLPDWIRDLAHVATVSDDAPPAMAASDADVAEIRAALEYICSDDRQVWVDVGMAIHNDVGRQAGFDLWDTWSQASHKYNPADSTRVWRSFSRKGISGITKATVFALAQRGGWLNTGIAVLHAPVPEESVTPVETKEPGKTPYHLLNPPGILGEVARWIGATSRKPQPQFDVQGAIAFCATVMGRRYRTDQNNWPSLYLLNIGKSASGKEHAKWAVEKLLEACDLANLIGPSSYTSNSGVLSALHGQPSHITIIDEFGKVLEAASIKNNARANSALTCLMEVWARCDGTMRPQGYSTFGMDEKAAKMMRDRSVCNPALTILGMTTPDTFFDAIGSAAARDGFLNRLLIVESDIGRQVGSASSNDEIPKSVIAWATEAHAYDGLANPDMTPSLQAVTKTIPISGGARRLFADFEREAVGLMDAHDEAGLAEMFGRCCEISMRLALIVAVGCGDDHVPEDAARWAIDYARHYTLRTVDKLATCVADSEFESIKKQVLQVITASREGLAEWELEKKSAMFRKMDQKGQVNVLSSLQFVRKIARVEKKKVRGPSSFKWVATTPDDETSPNSP